METNKRIEKAMKNRDYENIMRKASQSFVGELSEDEIKTCHLNAMWQALKNYKPEGGAKFLTYLYKGVIIECIRELKFNKKYKDHKRLHVNLAGNTFSQFRNVWRNEHFYLELEEELEFISNKEMVSDKLEGMSVKEIALKYNYNRETARRKIKKSLKQLAERMK